MILNRQSRLRAARLALQPARALHARGAKRAHKVVGHVSSPAAPALGGPGASAATRSLSLSAAAEEASSGGKPTFVRERTCQSQAKGPRHSALARERCLVPKRQALSSELGQKSPRAGSSGLATLRSRSSRVAVHPNRGGVLAPGWSKRLRKRVAAAAWSETARAAFASCRPRSPATWRGQLHQ